MTVRVKARLWGTWAHLTLQIGRWQFSCTPFQWACYRADTWETAGNEIDVRPLIHLGPFSIVKRQIGSVIR